MEMTRRTFVGSALMAAAGCTSTVRTTGPATGAKWYKGSLHNHTYWSDGRGFPEDCAAAYKALGYGFLFITDHNRIGENPDYWRDVEPSDGGWPPNVNQHVFDHYVKTYPHAKTRTGVNGKTQVRIQPIDETIRMFSEEGKYLVMKGVELTYSMSGANRHDVHMNYLNVPEVIPDAAKDWLIADRPDTPVREVVQRNWDAVQALAAKHGNPPSLFMVNHPQWPCLDVTADDFLSLPQVRYFEICNGGADYPEPPELPSDGWENDRLWDAVNAVRARRGEALLYATGTDDSHWYPGNGHDRPEHTTCTPGDAWVCVRAESLTPAALFAAMDRGDFYASCGVDLDDVAFDGRTLSVSVPAKPGVAYRVRFIVSKKDFCDQPHQVNTAFPIGSSPKGRPRTVAVYGSGVGVAVKTVSFAAGEAASASYTLAEDDLYVRARIESSEPSLVPQTTSFHPRCQCAWTQPYVRPAASWRTLGAWTFRADGEQPSAGNALALVNHGVSFSADGAVFDGDAHFRTTAPLDLSGFSSVAFSCRFRSADPHATGYILAPDDSSKKGTFVVYQHMDKFFGQFRIQDGTSPETWQQEMCAMPMDDGFHELKYVIDYASAGAGRARLFLDGREVPNSGLTGAGDFTVRPPAHPLFIGVLGKDGGVAHGFKGVISELRVETLPKR